MAASLPAISGKQLIRLFRKDGWVECGRRTHGIMFQKQDTSGRMRITIIPDKRAALPHGTLAAILGPRQSNIGRSGLQALIAQHGL